MSYGTGSGGKDIIYFKMRGLKKSDKELYFEGQKSEGGEYKIIEEKPTFIQGGLTEVKTDSYEYEGDTINSIKFTLEDMDTKLVLESGFNNLAISLINTLAGSPDFGEVKLSLYTGKSGYPSLFIELDGGVTKTEWKWDYKKDFAPKIKKTKFKGKDLTDKSELETFLIKYVNTKEFQDKLSGLPTPSVEQPDSGGFETTDEIIDEADSDLPF